MSFPFAMAGYAWRGALAGLMAASLLLPVLARAAGDEVHEAKQATAAGVKPSQGGAQHKISPHLKARRERAQAQKPERRPTFRLSVRGAQKASSH
jgi:hypothetical protein